MTRNGLKVTAVRLSHALGWLDLANRQLVGSYLAAHTRAPARNRARATSVFGPQHDLISNAAVVVTSMAVLGAVICVNPRKHESPPAAAAPQVTGSPQRPIEPEPEESFGGPAAFEPPAVVPAQPPPARHTLSTEEWEPPAKATPPTDGARPKQKKRDCKPNFYLDAEGEKHVKPECL